jgi:hypothetical protein
VKQPSYQPLHYAAIAINMQAICMSSGYQLPAVVSCNDGWLLEVGRGLGQYINIAAAPNF